MMAKHAISPVSTNGNLNCCSSKDQCDQAGALRQGSGRDYSMISSICASKAGEMVNPSACAVFRLITA
jgi:hypothetical protein